MRVAARRNFATLVCVAIGLMWVVASWSKLVEPFAAYEFSARIVGGGLTAKSAVTGQVLFEALLGLAMLLGLMRGLRVSLAALLVLTALLLWLQSEGGGTVKCACFVAIMDADVDDALVRNGVLIAVTGFAALIDPRRIKDAATTATPAVVSG